MERQHPGAQELGARATVHSSLEGFQSVDLPLGLAVAPALGQRVPDGVDISPQCADEAPHSVDARALGVIQPDVEPLSVFAPKNASESHGKLTHCGEVWRRALQGFDLRRLTSCQQRTRLDAERCGDDRRDQPAGRGIDGVRRRDRGRRRQHVGFGASPLRQKPLQVGETAGVAAEFDLVEQVSATNAAFRPSIMRSTVGERPFLGKAENRAERTVGRPAQPDAVTCWLLPNASEPFRRAWSPPWHGPSCRA
jgi:hypothetical protein